MFMVQYLCWERVGGFGGAARRFYISVFRVLTANLYLKQECYVLTLAALWYKTNNFLCGIQNVICVKYRSVDRSKKLCLHF